MTSLPIPSAGIKPILSVFLAAVVSGRKAMLVYVKRVTRGKPISDNVTNSFTVSRRVAFGASSSPLIRRYSPWRSHTMMHSPSPSMQREALVNCTNTTTDPIHNNPKPPTTPVHALFKRSRPTDDGGAHLKRLKFSIGESRTGEDERVDSADESEEEDSDGSSITYCTARRKRTIFHAKNALAMSRPGVTCRPLPCEPSSLVAPSCL
jgi:hypothetical protein